LAAAARSIPDQILGSPAVTPDAPALRGTVEGERSELTFRDLSRDTERFARGLLSMGLEPGERVLVLADNSPRWITSDLGILRAGGVTVHRAGDVAPEEAAYLLDHSGARAFIAGREVLLDRVDRSSPSVRFRVVLEGRGGDARTFEEVLEAGDRAGPDIRLPESEDLHRLATIVYTSGTTGTPKGVMLSHANIMHNVRVLPRVLDLHPQERFLCVLPPWHMFERTVEYTALAAGGVLAYSSIRTLRKDLATERPTFLAAVPRLWEGLMKGFLDRVEKKGRLGRGLARFLLAWAQAYAGHRLRQRGTIHVDRGAEPGTTLPPLLGVLLSAPLGVLGRAVLGRAVRRALGGCLRAGVSGGGLLPLHLDRFLDALGVNMLVGYGLSETSPVVALRDLYENVLGTIGRAIPETELRVVDEQGEPLRAGSVGELEVRGPQVMEGYYGDPEATRAALRPDGWFRTGDLCALTERGDVVFRGRAKDTIVLAGGENVEPAPIETRILVSPYVRQVLVAGQDRKTLSALIVPEREPAERESTARGISVEELLHTEVSRLVTRAAGFKPYELVPRVAVLDDEFTVEDGTLTMTQKLKRNVIFERFAELLDGLYA
jgi:long-chain acyl-CoA synthetase